MNAAQINEPISFTAPWGEKMNVDKGGYILQDPNNPNDIYGISGKDFDSTYRFNENKQYNKNRNIKQTIRLRESDLHKIVKESVKRVLKEDKTIKIAPDSDEIKLDGNVFYCTFNGMDIEWHVDYEVTDEEMSENLKEWLIAAIGMSGKIWQVPFLLNKNLPFSSDIYVNGKKVDYPSW